MSWFVGDTVSSSPATSVLISDPAGFNVQRVPVNGVSRSWSVTGSGTLSAEALSADLIALGLNDELRGHRITVLHDDAGTWSGIVSDPQPNGDGTTEIGATDLKALFGPVRLPRRSRSRYGPAGTLAQLAITESTRIIGTPVQDRSADDLGLSVALDFDGGYLRAKLDAMADETGQDWWIDPDTLAFRWGTRGQDRTATVCLIEGKHITDWRAPDALEPIVNDLEAFPTSDKAAIRQTVRTENAASIAAVGRRQGSEGIASGTHGIHIRSRAVGLVDELAQAGRSIEFDLVNIDRCFADFREGDTVLVLLPSISVRATVRILARSLDESGVMSLSGIVTARQVVA